MRALQIANEAFDSITHNLGAALRISLTVFLFIILLTGVLGFDFWQALFSGHVMKADFLIKSHPIRIVLVPLFVFLVGLYWITVAWHRFVILKEKPTGILPKFNGGRIWAYFWRLVVLSFVIGFVGLLPLVLISSSITGASSVNIGDYSNAIETGFIGIIINMIGTAIFAYAFLRYSPFLVAAAIDQPILAKTARASTYWARWDIFLMAVGYSVVTLINAVAGSGFATGFWPIDLFIVLAIQWAAFMFTISLLTTLYQKSAEQNAGTDIARDNG